MHSGMHWLTHYVHLPLKRCVIICEVQWLALAWVGSFNMRIHKNGKLMIAHCDRIHSCGTEFTPVAAKRSHPKHCILTLSLTLNATTGPRTIEAQNRNQVSGKSPVCTASKHESVSRWCRTHPSSQHSTLAGCRCRRAATLSAVKDQAEPPCCAALHNGL